MARRAQGGPSAVDGWMQLATRFLARRDRTVAQVERFLRSKGALPLQITQTIHRLSDLRYLDDQAYAHRWVERKLRVRPVGPDRMKAELQAQGIAEPVVNQVIAAMFREVDEERLARRVLQAKQRHGDRLTLAQSVRFLRQRGFHEETIDRIVMVAGDSDEGLDS
ncbi:MAG: regulatory protein RecX [Nitrospira sp.]